MRGGGVAIRTLAISISIPISIAGCGDPPACPGPARIAIAPVSVVDGNAATAGVQTEIALTTSLAAGEQVALEIDDASGAMVAALTAPVDADGRVVFAGVSVPPPHATVRAIGHGLCGIARAERSFDVPGSACAVTLVPAPTSNAFYAPRGVLNEASDPDPATPGVQTTLQVATLPGWTAELFETTAGEHSLGIRSADARGAIAWPVTMLDGPVAYRAICRGAGSATESPSLALVADSTPPACSLAGPLAGTTITPAFDANDDLGDGIQLALGASATGGDVVAEPVSWTIAADGGAPAALGSGAIGADGTSALSATLPAVHASYDVAATLDDHAGNACATHASYAVVLDGCELAVTAPLATVTQDADGNPANGAQVDVSLSVAPACVGRLVTSTCGLNGPSGFVSPQGTITLRAQLCAQSPCHARSLCAFQVTKLGGGTVQTVAPIEIDNRGL